MKKQTPSRRIGLRAMDWRMKAVTHNAFWAVAPTGKRVCLRSGFDNGFNFVVSDWQVTPENVC